MPRATLLTGLAFLVLLSACGDPDDRRAAPEAPVTAEEPSAGAQPDEPFAGFDREGARAQAQALLGLAEGRVRPSPDVRIVRRGEERFPVTMDLRPGRKNVELDDDGTGRYVVSRVVVETPEGSFTVD